MAKLFTTLVIAALVAYVAMIWTATAACACSPSLPDSAYAVPTLGRSFREVAHQQAASYRATGRFLADTQSLRELALPVGAVLLDTRATDSTYQVTLGGDVPGGPRRCTVAGHRRDVGDGARFTVDCVRDSARVGATRAR